MKDLRELIGRDLLGVGLLAKTLDVTNCRAWQFVIEVIVQRHLGHGTTSRLLDRRRQTQTPHFTEVLLFSLTHHSRFGFRER